MKLTSFLIALGLCSISFSQSNVVTNFASIGGIGDEDLPTNQARFYYPRALAVTPSGDIFVADYGNYKVRKITSSGTVSTYAGTGVGGIANGPVATATFNTLNSIVVDNAGVVFVGDGSQIRKISGGIVSSFVGTFTNGSADGTGTAASFSQEINGMVFDASGNMYVTDTYNHKIRKITPAGVVTTFAGSGSAGGLDGTGNTATFNGPCGIAIDQSGNLYVSEILGYRIRKITPAGVVSTLAGSGAVGVVDGTGTAASFSNPRDLAIDNTGNIFVTEQSYNKIRKITPAGVVTTYAGTLAAIPGCANGTGTAALFYQPIGIDIDGSGNLVVCEWGNNTIRKISSAAVVTTFASEGGLGFANGTGSAARFYAPTGAVCDASGNLYVTDIGNYRIRKITPSGVVTTFAGSGSLGTSDGTGAGASFSNVNDITIDNSGNFYVADAHRIRKITPAGVVTTLCGATTSGFVDGTGSAAKFNNIAGITCDASGNLYVADRYNHAIRKITPAGLVTTIAGSGTSGNIDATGAAASFSNPMDVVLASNGDVFVADAYNYKIRRVTQLGVVTTFAGNGVYGLVNGTGTATQFSGLGKMIIDAADNIFIADNGNAVIRKITSVAVVTTYCGTGKKGSKNGAGTIARFASPFGIAMNATGEIYVTDQLNQTIRKIGLCPNYTSSPISTNVTCNGLGNGQASVVVNGGMNSFTYDWTPGTPVGDGSNAVSGLAPATYICNVTDANGCLTTQSFTITQPTALSASRTFTNVTCNGGSNGAINVTVVGGTAPYTFLWSDGAITEDRTGLTAGSYNCLITDFKGCTFSIAATLAQPATAVTGTTNITNVNCFGGNNGAIDLTPSGGQSPYTYNWGGITSQDRVNLIAGTYAVTITDAIGCNTTLTPVVTQPTVLDASAVANNVTCFGYNDGSIDLTPYGGSPGYTYNWGNGITSQDRSGLANGTYSVTITDSHGCTKIVASTITQPSQISAIETVTNVSCFGGTDGAIHITTSGGQMPHTIYWEGVSGTEDLSGLVAGSYGLTVMDDQGCSFTESISVLEPTQIVTSQNVSSCVSYNWSATNQSYTTSGNYTTTLTANNGCDSIVNLNLTINTPTSAIDTITSCGAYTWIDGSTYSSSNSSATHTLMNVNGCDSLVSLNLTILQPTEAIDVVSECDSYSWIDGITYTSSNNFATHTLTNIAGCDSIVTLDLTIRHSSSATDILAACNAYTWIDGITYTSSNDVATYTISNAQGCDSVVTLNLTINSNPQVTATDNGDLTITASGGNTYQWINCGTNALIAGATSSTLTVSANGSYAAIGMSADNCSDTSECVEINYVGLQDKSLSEVLVSPNPTNDLVVIAFDAAKAILIIRDAQGKLIRQSEIVSGEKVSLVNVETGVYFFELQSQEINAVLRVVKN